MLILDHHLLRCEEGLSWLDYLSSETGRRVICAADFMGHPRCLFEARREQLYEEMPVPKDGTKPMPVATPTRTAMGIMCPWRV